MKKFLYVTFLLLLLFSIYEIFKTYGLLESIGNADIEEPIGKWEITLNGLDVTLTQEITPNDLIYENTNNNIEPGYFAPGVSASYEIIIDPKNTDVSIRYDIIADLNDISSHPNISFDVTGDIIRNENESGTIYTGMIPLSEVKQGEKKTLRVSLIWSDDENYNEDDTKLGEINQSLNIKISITFSQYMGEVL